MGKKVFIICPVRNVTDEMKKRIEMYVEMLEQMGRDVYYPSRDTHQETAGINICRQNLHGITDADEVHIFYTAESKGTHFDMGMAFALSKKIVSVLLPEYGEGKSFPRMLVEWANITGFVRS